MLVTDVNGGAMVVSSFVKADVPKRVKGGAMVVSGFMIMIVMNEVKSPYCHIGEARKNR
jgi:hypothetical protein